MRRDRVEHALANGRARCRPRRGRRRRRSARSVRSKPLSPTVVAAATRSRPCSSLQACGLATAFSMSLTVIRPTQRYCVVDHQQLLDAVLVQQALGLVLADALAHRDQPVLGHQLGDRLARIGGEAHVAVGEDADQLAAALAVAAALRPPGCRRCRARFISSSASASVASGSMVTGLTTMPDSNFLTWRTCSACSSRLEVAVDDADAAGLRHGDGQLASVTVSMAEAMIGMLSAIARVMRRADVDLGRHHLGQAGLEQHVVEGERLARIAVVFRGHRQLQLARLVGLIGAIGNRGYIGASAARADCLAASRRPAFGLAAVVSTGIARFHRAIAPWLLRTWLPALMGLLAQRLRLKTRG